MAFVHRYFAKVDVERLRAACAKAWWRPLRIGGLGEWSCVELRGAALELPFLRRISAACGESLGLAANTGANSDVHGVDAEELDHSSDSAAPWSWLSSK